MKVDWGETLTGIVIGAMILGVIAVFTVGSIYGGSLLATETYSLKQYFGEQGFVIVSRPYLSSDFENDWLSSLPEVDLRLSDFVKKANDCKVTFIYADYENEYDKKWVAFWFVAEDTKYELFENYVPQDYLSNVETGEKV